MADPGLITSVLRSRILRNALGLYVLQFGSYLLPVATLVLLARLLGPRGWGDLVFIQAFASYGMLAANYGFSYSATRDVARHREEPSELANLLAGVLGARIALAALAICVMVPVALTLPQVHRDVSLLAPALVWAFGFSFSLSWFYQGLERMAFIARWETAARLLSLAGLLALVRGPGDAWKVLAIQGGLQWAAICVEMVVTYRRVPFRRPTVQLVRRALRRGWSMFLFTGALSFFTVGNAFILGLLATPAAVGYYAGAEKVSRAFASMLYPVTQSVFPRISQLVITARYEAALMVRRSLLVVGGAGVLMAIFIFAAAPLLVRLLLGPGFEDAVVVLRILSLLPPLIAVSNVFGIQWSLALNLDRLVTGIIAAASVLNVSLALILVPRHLQVGMALAVVSSEALVAFGLYAALRVKALDPLAMAAPPRSEPSSLAHVG